MRTSVRFLGATALAVGLLGGLSGQAFAGSDPTVTGAIGGSGANGGESGDPNNIACGVNVLNALAGLDEDCSGGTGGTGGTGGGAFTEIG